MSTAEAVEADSGLSYTDAARFLEQSTFGPSPESIAYLQQVGVEVFLNEQFHAPPTSFPDLPMEWPGQVPVSCTGTCPRDNYSVYPLQTVFFRNALIGGDQLRQRVTFALNQIFVTSAVDADLRLASRMTHYLRMLSDNAFGNFRDLLRAVTLHPVMGNYLDMAGNNRANPNENYAREFLQLFSIGLHELNDDGTVRTDGNGSPLPTYDQDAVVAFSRVFTGWNLAAAPAPGIANYRDPMVLNQNNHDVGAKRLLGGVVLPAGQNGRVELDAAIDNVFLHRNVGPFFGRQLIQKLVTSNPSPGYVARVAAAFNADHAGVRGNIKHVVRAILIDPEARADQPGPSFGKLKEPVLALTNLLRAFDTTDATTDFVLGDSFLPASLRLGQDVFRAPSVFNFYPPDAPAPGTDLLGPEFALQSTATALARINLLYALIYRTLAVSADRPKSTWVELAGLEPLAADPAALVEAVNVRLLYGTMSIPMRAIVTERVAAVAAADRRGRARRAVYLVATSSAYQVQR
ncbi:MAG: DUF1800 domain-containing protein [Acidimicrobiales bacterium]